MMKKMRMLSDRRGAVRADMDAEKTDRLVSAVLKGDSGHTAELAGGTADEEVLETLRLIASIRQVGASDTPVSETSVDAIMGALEREARGVPRPSAWRECLGMASGFLACTLTLGSGLLLMGGTGYLRPPDAVAAPVLAAAVASLAALASVLVHRRPQLRQPILPLLVLVMLGIGACAPKLQDTSPVEFDAAGNFVSSTPAAITGESVRADIRSVTFGDPFRVVEDDTGIWAAAYPGGISRADDFWGGRIVRHAPGDAEPAVVVDFAVDLPGAASRVPDTGLAPVPLWDGCPDGVVAVLDPVDASLHLYRPGGTKDRRITLPWTGRPLSHGERLGYVRAMMHNEMQGANVADAEIERAAADVLARAGDHLAAEAPAGIDLRCSPGRIWIQEFDGSSHPLGYGRTWMTVALDDAAPRFQRVVFPDGFTPYRLTDSVAIGVVTDSVELQRVAVARLPAVFRPQQP